MENKKEPTMYKYIYISVYTILGLDFRHFKLACCYGA